MLLRTTTASGTGFPCVSKTVPETPTRSWAAARGGASDRLQRSRTATRMPSLRCMDFPSSFESGSLRHPRAIRDRVGHACFCERAQPQQAAIARAAGLLLALVARPGEMERGAQFDSPADDIAFPHANHRGLDFNPRFRPRTRAHQLLKRTVIFRPAVRVAGAVFGHRADPYGSRADGFRPAHRDGEKVSVAEGHVGDRDAFVRAGPACRPGR